MIEKSVNESYVKSNAIIYIIAYSMRAISLMCASGSLIQTFLSTLGFESGLIYVHTTALQAANVATIILASHWADKGSVIKRTAISEIPLGAFFLIYIPIAIAKNSSPITYVLLIIIGAVQQISIGLHTVCDYKMPYYIFKQEKYGKIMSIAGTISSVATLVLSAVMTALVSNFGFLNVFPYAAAVSFLCMAISCVITLQMRNINKEAGAKSGPEADECSVRVNVFREKIFWHFVPANLLRGINSGVITVLAAVAFDLGYSETVTTAMVTVQSIASLVACVLMALMITHFSYKNTVLVGSLTMILFPLLLVKNSLLFLIVYAAIIFGRTFIDYGVPAMLLGIVPVEMAGPYNAWRMALHNAGILIGTISATVIPTAALLVIATLTQLVSGVTYFTSRHKFTI